MEENKVRVRSKKVNGIAIKLHEYPEAQAVRVIIGTTEWIVRISEVENVETKAEKFTKNNPTFLKLWKGGVTKTKDLADALCVSKTTARRLVRKADDLDLID